MPEKEGRVLDAATVRAWCATSLDALGRAREEIDSINVYPVADGDTGTNLYLTMEAAAQAVDALFRAHESDSDACPVTAAGAPAAAPTAPSLAEVVRGMAHGALVGARGNSGTILAQLLRGMAQVLAEEPERLNGAAADTGPADGAAALAALRRDTCHVADGTRLSLALRTAARSAYQAVAHPVEGTVLTVATAAADACTATRGDCLAVARAAYDGARAALAATPGQLATLGRAGVVDAGGRGLLTVLGALVEVLGGAAVGGGIPLRPARWQERAPRHAPAPETVAATCDADTPHWDGTGPGYEVIYLLDAEDTAVNHLRRRLDGLGDSLVVVGGDGLWNVHVHVDDAGAAIEAGIEAGRPHRIRITHFAAEAHVAGLPAAPTGERAPRGIVAVVPGAGLAELYAEAGATTVPARPGELPGSGELAEAVRRAHAHEVVLLPNDAALRHTASAAAEDARRLGVRVSVVPTRSPVQGIAALAVHERGRRFDEDVVAMTAAAGATRYAELTVAEHQSWTSAGICQAGDVLGLIDGDVAVIGDDVAGTARTVLDRMLAAGGEMVTLVLGEDAADELPDRLEEHVREHHLAVDTVVYDGGRNSALLLIGVE